MTVRFQRFDGSNQHLIKATGTVPSPPSQVFQFIKDNVNTREFDKMMIENSVLEKYTDHLELVYQSFEVPLLSNR